MKLRNGCGKLDVGCGKNRNRHRFGFLFPTSHHQRPTNSRKGFTLLEVLLATVIGTMIMGGLYVVMNMTVNQTQASREAMDTESTSRAVFNKIGLDLSSVLGPAPPKSGGTPASGSTGGATSTAPTTGAATGATGGTGTDTGASSPDDTSGAASGSGDTTQSSTQNFPFQVGVLGTSTQLTIFASRVPNALATPGLLNQQSDTAFTSDLVRIDYWKGSGGLCRQERPWVTADQTGNTFGFDLSNEASSLIADDVSDVLFEYFDGTSWVQTWEGGSGTIPNPPAAVRVTLSFAKKDTTGGSATSRTISQTIAVRTAPGSVSPELVDPVIPTDAMTEQSDMSSTASGGSSATTGGSSATGGGSSATSGGGSTSGKGGTTGGTGGTTGGSTKGGATGGRGGGGK